MSYEPRKPRKPRTSPELSEAWLMSEAGNHLNRYWPSISMMRRVLWRRADRAISVHGGSRGAASEMIDVVIQRLIDNRLLDDERFTEAWVRRLREKGHSRADIRARLRKKGVAAETIQDAMVVPEDDLDRPDPERVSAARYARRRRFGPMRLDAEKRADRRQKDIAAMCRAGFPYHLSREVIDSEDLGLILDPPEFDP